MAEYLGVSCPHLDSTETGGSSYLVHVGHAADAIAAGHAHVALITLAGKPRNGGDARLGIRAAVGARVPVRVRLRRRRWSATTPSPRSATCTSSAPPVAQLAEIKVAASVHAQYNPNAFLPNVVTVDEVLESPMVADPLHRLDCA